jgi:hypothetical protein
MLQEMLPFGDEPVEAEVPNVENAEVEGVPDALPHGRWNLLRRSWQQRRTEKTSAERRLTLARSRRLQRCGRAVALWSLAFYVVVQAAVMAASYRLIMPPLPGRVWNRKRQLLHELTAQAPDQPLLLMIGSSRTEMGFNSWNMTDLKSPEGKPLVAFNCGVPQIGPLREKMYLRELLDAGIRPRVLLVEFLPPLLNDPRRHLNSEEGWISPAWLSPWELGQVWPYLKHPNHYAYTWVGSRVAPAYMFRADIRLTLVTKLDPAGGLPPLPDRDRLGYYLPDWRARNKKNSAPCYVDMPWQICLASLRVSPGPAQAMRDLVAMCRRERIPLALVVMPEANYFRQYYRPEGLADANRLLAELRDTWDVPVIDANRWIADEEFMDGHHLFLKGANQFTNRLRQEVSRLLAEGRLECPAP